MKKVIQCCNCTWFRLFPDGGSMCMHKVKPVDGIDPACEEAVERPKKMKLTYQDK